MLASLCDGSERSSPTFWKLFEQQYFVRTENKCSVSSSTYCISLHWNIFYLLEKFYAEKDTMSAYSYTAVQATGEEMRGCHVRFEKKPYGIKGKDVKSLEDVIL